MTQYLLSVHASDSDYDTPIEVAQPMYDATEVYTQEIKADGTWVFHGGLKRWRARSGPVGPGSRSARSRANEPHTPAW